MTDTLTPPKTIRLRLVSLTPDQAMSSLLGEDVEATLVKRLGIVPAPGRSQLHRWLEVMAQENGVDLRTMQDHVRILRDPVSAYAAGIEPIPSLTSWILAIA